MITIYEAEETEFHHAGKGVLSDIVNPQVVEELNGQFYFEFQYLPGGNNFREIQVDRIIKADANPRLPEQLFRIVRIQRVGKGLATIYAEHVSNHTAQLQLSSDFHFSGTATSALKKWADTIVVEHPFTTHSDLSKVAQGELLFSDTDNAREALGGIDGSILAVYGGEYRFDNYRISLLERRGFDRGVTVRYGKNLVDLDQEDEIASVATTLFPYASYTPKRELVDKENPDKDSSDKIPDPEEIFVTLPEKTIDSQNVDNFARRNIAKKDFNSELSEFYEELNNKYDYSNKTVIKEQITKKLREVAVGYMEAHSFGIPKVNLRVEFVDLARTLDYKGRIGVEDIGLGDWVTVEFPKIGVSKKAQVTVAHYDPKNKRYLHIDIGEMRMNLTQKINHEIIDLTGKYEGLDEQITHVQTAANGKNKVFRGAVTPEGNLQNGDLWYKPVSDGEYEMYIYEAGEWVLVVHSGMSEGIKKELEEVEREFEEARERTEALELDANSILSGLGVDTVGAIHQELSDSIHSKVGVRINRVTETTDLYERVIGSSEADVKNNVARIVMADNIFRSQVSNRISGLSTSVTQLSDSWALRLEKNDDLVTAINATTDGVYIKGKSIQLDGDVDVAGSFKVTDRMVANDISASKITTGRLNGYQVDIVNLNAENIVTGTLDSIEVKGLYGYIGDWNLRGGVLYSPLINGGHTTLKATGNVALGTQSPSPFSTTNAGLQIWHNGQLRWKNGEGLIWSGVTSGLVIESKSYIHLRPSASVEVDGRVIPRYSGQGTLGADDKRWYRSYVTVAESVVSDARLKANIKDIPDELIEMLMSLRVKSYEIEGKKHFGYIAQDVERVLYKYAVNKVGHENASDYVKEFDMLGKTESYLSLVYTEIATLKAEEAQRRIETLEQRLEALENGE